MKDKRILVIGGSGSIGSTLIKKLKENNIECISTHTGPKNNKYHYFDFYSDKSYNDLRKLLPMIDGIIFTSGYEPKLNLEDLTKDHALKMFNIHILGPMFLLKKLKEKLNENSSIIFISSVAAFKGSYDPTYSAAKGAINSLTKTLAKDLAPKVRVNAIAPGLIYKSKVYNMMTPDFRKKHLKSSILNKYLTADECADAIIFLLSNNHITGEILQLNGGQYFG